MLKTLDMIFEFGYEAFTADVVKTIKLYCLEKDKDLLKDLDIKDRTPKEWETIVDHEKTLKSWSKKEKNLLGELVEDNQGLKELFIKAYNSKIDFKEKPIARGKLLKELKTFKNLFSMYPYQEHKELAQEVYTMVINNHLKLDNKKNLSFIKEGFKDFIDAQTMKELISDVKANSLDTPTVLLMKQAKLIKDKNNQESKILKGSYLFFGAGVTALTAGTVGLSLSSMAVGTFIAYSGVKKIFEKIIKIEDKKQVKYASIESLAQEKKANELVASELLLNMLFSRKYDEVNDRQSIILSAFLNEKLSEVKKVHDEAVSINNNKEKTVKIPKELNGRIGKEESNRLDALTFEDIQQIGTVKDHKLRDFITLNSMSVTELNAIRMMDKHLAIKNDSSNVDLNIGKYIEQAKENKLSEGFIKNLETIKEFLSDASTVDATILRTYLNINTSKLGSESRINESVLNGLFTDNKLNYVSLHKTMNHEYENALVSLKEEGEKNALKEIATNTLQLITAPIYTINEMKESLKKFDYNKFNREIAKDIKKVSYDNYYDQAPDRVERISSFLNNALPHKAIELVNNTVSILEKMRAKSESKNRWNLT
jgi:hypothetical protein